MGNRRLQNRSRSEYKRHRQREAKRLANKRRQIRIIPRNIPDGYYEIDKVIVGYMCEYFKSINPRQSFSTHRQHALKGVWLRHRLPLCMHKEHDKTVISELTVASVGYMNDIVSVRVDIMRVKQSFSFKHQFSSPAFFQKFLLFLDHMNLYYWCPEVADQIERLGEPILQRLLNIACLPCDVGCIESGKAAIGCNFIVIRDGYVLTNNCSVATLERAVLDPYGVAGKLREALAHDIPW